jgi:hypothetical protein
LVFSWKTKHMSTHIYIKVVRFLKQYEISMLALWSTWLPWVITLRKHVRFVSICEHLSNNYGLPVVL